MSNKPRCSGLPSLKAFRPEVEDHDVVLLLRGDGLGQDALAAVVDAVGGAGVEGAAERLSGLHAQCRRQHEGPIARYEPFSLNVHVEKS